MLELILIVLLVALPILIWEPWVPKYDEVKARELDRLRAEKRKDDIFEGRIKKEWWEE